MANPYLQVLRTPHALPMVLAAFIGRLPLSMVGLGCVLLVASETGSYGLGGAVAAVGAVTTALAGPVLGRLADSHGQRRVLLPVLAVFVPSGLTFLFAVREDWRRRGIGTALTALSMENARTAGCDLAYLNPSAIGIFGWSRSCCRRASSSRPFISGMLRSSSTSVRSGLAASMP